MEQPHCAVLHCTAGDVLIGAGALLLALVVGREAAPAVWAWGRIAALAVLFGAGYTVFSEWLNVSVLRSWAYTEAMPRLSLGEFDLGPSPWALPAAGVYNDAATMTKRLLRRVAIGLIGLLIFAQASVTLADCPMDRGMLSLTLGTEGGEPCGDCGSSVSEFGSLYVNRCVSHCTADLQLSSVPVALVPHAVYALAFVLEPPAVDIGLAALHDPPLREVPRRILLHSYLI